MLSVMMLVPSAMESKTAAWDCMSVGKPGCGMVLTLQWRRGPVRRTRMESSNSSISPAHLLQLSRNGFQMLGDHSLK